VRGAEGISSEEDACFQACLPVALSKAMSDCDSSAAVDDGEVFSRAGRNRRIPPLAVGLTTGVGLPDFLAVHVEGDCAALAPVDEHVLAVGRGVLLV